jgi:hypothetical protein
LSGSFPVNEGSSPGGGSACTRVERLTPARYGTIHSHQAADKLPGPPSPPGPPEPPGPPDPPGPPGRSERGKDEKRESRRGGGERDVRDTKKEEPQPKGEVKDVKQREKDSARRDSACVLPPFPASRPVCALPHESLT